MHSKTNVDLKKREKPTEWKEQFVQFLKYLKLSLSYASVMFNK